MIRAAALAAALAVAACAQMEGSVHDTRDAQSLAAAETAFAAQSVREDMRAAFLANFAADGVLVRRGGWVAARDALEPLPAPPIVLDWRPAYTEVAASGEIGLSTGPWKITRKDNPAAAPAYGQFVSLWRREDADPWRVIVDLGIDHPQSAFWDAPLEAMPAPGIAAPAGDDVAQAERRLAAEALLAGEREVLARHASPRLRFYREGAAPFVGVEAALASMPAGGERIEWTVEKSETARSRDFGYARGRYARAGDSEPRGYFLRVWRREAAGWRIALSVTNPIPR